MRAQFVVPKPENIQLPLGLAARWQRLLPPPQALFEGAEEALDAPVLPRRGHLSALVADSEKKKWEPEDSRGTSAQSRTSARSEVIP